MAYGRDSPDRKIHLILLLSDGKEVNSHLAEKLNCLTQFAAIIPVISKADTFGVNEIKRAKEVFTRSARVTGVEWFDAKSVVSSQEVPEKPGEQGIPRNDPLRTRALSSIRHGKREQLHH